VDKKNPVRGSVDGWEAVVGGEGGGEFSCKREIVVGQGRMANQGRIRRRNINIPWAAGDYSLQIPITMGSDVWMAEGR
jgi:hypothetical protein